MKLSVLTIFEILCDVGCVGSSPASGEPARVTGGGSQSAAKLSHDHRHLPLSLSLCMILSQQPAQERLPARLWDKWGVRNCLSLSEFYDLPRCDGQHHHHLRPDDVGGGSGQPGPADPSSLHPQRSRRTHPGEQSEYRGEGGGGSFLDQAACLAPLCLVFPPQHTSSAPSANTEWTAKLSLLC